MSWTSTQALPHFLVETVVRAATAAAENGRVCKCSLGNKEKLRGMKLAHLCSLCLGNSET